MDKIQKALQKLAVKEREVIKSILCKLNNNDFNDLDIKKLKGRSDIYRIRQGKIRIIYRIVKDKSTMILAIERRNDNTYNL